jgi:hypothetical protein
MRIRRTRVAPALNVFNIGPPLPINNKVLCEVKGSRKASCNHSRL